MSQKKPIIWYRSDDDKEPWPSLRKVEDSLKNKDAEIAALKEELEAARKTFEQLKNLVNNDFVVSETEDGEKEYWVRNDDLQYACEETIARIDNFLKGGKK